MKLLLHLCAISLLVSCTSRTKAGSSAADVWHIGHAIEVQNGKVEQKTLMMMASSLKAIAVRWAEDLGGTINEEAGSAIQPER